MPGTWRGKGRTLVVENVCPPEPGEIARRLEALIGREQFSEDYVRFRIELLKSQTAVLDALARSAHTPCSQAAKDEQSAKSPALEPDEVPFDRALLGRLLDDLSAPLGRGDQRSEDLTRLSAAAANEPEILEQLARQAAFGPNEAALASLSERLNVTPEALLFFGRVLCAPFVTEAVRRGKQRGVRAAKSAGSCPWCGSTPGLAKLKREEGKRVLFCSLCGESWDFARLQCPLCGSQKALGALSLEADDPCAIETCDACKGYLKTVDERKLPEHQTVVPLVETTATLYLDMIAENEGYARGMPYAALR